MARKLTKPLFILAMAGMTALFAAIGHDNNTEWRMLNYARALEASEVDGYAAGSKKECIVEAWQRPRVSATRSECSRYEVGSAQPEAVLAARDEEDNY